MKNILSNRLNGFTLIELLVVVLIIGILAAVALPQYDKAVEKARASEALPILKSVYQAAAAYQMSNGTWPRNFDELAVEIPWTGNVKWRNSSVMRDTRSNNLWSLQIYEETGYGWTLMLGRISGKYKGAGFMIGEQGDLACAERVADGFVFEGNEGDYCIKIMRSAPASYTDWNIRAYPYKS
ncbi:type IV pilin protein [Candidatus Avelusimicrobium luingense]|uniref:type IV pilin protein n=1 Tax=Candidatus Avelusimicrobium luingense TaxID=3416211 RepID=UPI003D1176CC